MAEDPIRLSGFGLSFGEQVVFSELDLCVGRRGVHLLMGPVGAGKSALLRTLAGLNHAQPALRTWGGCQCRPERLALVGQDARFLISSVRQNLCAALPDRGGLTRGEQLERIREALAREDLLEPCGDLERDVIELPLHVQRRLAIMRGALAEPAVLCLDEPTAGLGETDANAVADLVARCAELRAVWLVTHDQRVARRLGGQMTLVAGGRAQDQGPTRRVLEAPRGAAAQQFVRSGSCKAPSPNTPPEMLGSDVPPPLPLPARARRSIARARGPRHFFWLLDGQLGGLPRPGVMRDVEDDVRGLQELGVRVLYTLEEKRTVPKELLEDAGIESRWQPIADMGVPSLETMAALCDDMEGQMANGKPCAVHCLAGLGRTGTVLACALIARGARAGVALDRVRALRTWSVQSPAQHEFLVSFEAFVRAGLGEVFG